MCGEKRSISRFLSIQLGSPPRVRGKASPSAGTGSKDRITPACAGKRAVLTFSLGIFRDHPRVCGEKKLLFAEISNTPGSPPRVRGKVLFGYPVFSMFQDHPRVCGEKDVRLSRCLHLLGSPPRVRGKGIT